MMTLEQLTLNGATTLLTYLQCARLTDQAIGATALAATLCEMLNQLEINHPGIANEYGWAKHSTTDEMADPGYVQFSGIDSDRDTDFDLSRLS